MSAISLAIGSACFSGAFHLFAPSPDENQKDPCGRLLPNLFGRDCLTA